MNKTEKQITKYQLQQEQKTLRELKQVYAQASKDLQKSINDLNLRSDMQNLQSIIYQKKYQEALKNQIDGVLNKLNTGSYQTIDDYLQDSYQNGYIGNMYLLQKQTGCTVCVPIDQKKVVKALQTDSKLSTAYYQENKLKGRLAEDTKKLKTSIRAELSRGIANGETWQQIAYKIASGMNNPLDKAMRDAMRIARTEGHRVNQEGFLDAGAIAKKKGADIVKQWDATLDSNTRPWHREADGQIKEWDDYFIVNGEKMKAPSVGGSASNVCNCRCQLLQRAKWALDEDELKELQRRSDFFMNTHGDKPKDFTEFKQKYLQLPKNADKMDIITLKTPVKSSDKNCQEVLDNAKKAGITYNPVEKQNSTRTRNEMIKSLAGGDNTSGSCASVGLAYIGQRQGLDVLDFRGGSSQSYFSSSGTLLNISKMDGIKALHASGASSLTVGNRLLKQCEVGKEYYLAVGRHASIVRKTEDGKLQYLEMQSARNSGWIDFDGNPKFTLSNRFGCTSRSNYGYSETYDFMIDIDESDFDTDDFKSILGYINTEESEQKKGVHGRIK